MVVGVKVIVGIKEDEETAVEVRGEAVVVGAGVEGKAEKRSDPGFNSRGVADSPQMSYVGTLWNWQRRAIFHLSVTPLQHGRPQSLGW